MGDHIAYCERNELKAEIGRLRAELANARLERDNIAALNSSLIAELATVQEKYERTERQWIADVRMWQQECRDGAAKDAHIAELETDHLFAENKRLREACQEFRARAEKAEKRVGELENKNSYNLQIVREATTRAERAEARAAVAERINLEIMVGQERAEAEADSLRSTIDNMRAMNVKLTWETTGKGLAAEAELKAMREALLSYIADYENPEQICHNGYTYEKARAALNRSPANEKLK